MTYKGGKCELCGYRKCLAAMDFHHRDPAHKEFGIGAAYNIAWARLQREIDKCQLVCRNCHSEIHEEIALADRRRRKERNLMREDRVIRSVS